MRVALCLYGLTGSVDFGFGLGKPIDPRIGHYHHNKRIIEPNENVDVFFHTWSTDFENMLSYKNAICESKENPEKKQAVP